MSKPSSLKWTSISTFATILIGACTPQHSPEDFARATQGYIADVNKIFVVDCLLPGQVRKLGSNFTYLSARRPIRTSAADCEVRGGEYVAYDRANYNTALQVWLPKAEEGDASAQLYVGQIYEKGLGRAPDYSSAATWYRKSAAQGNPEAQINLGHLYERGLGVPKDQRMAAQWYGKASGLSGAGIQFASAAAASSDVSAEVQELQALRENARQQNAESHQLRSELNQAQQRLFDQQAALRRAQEDLETTRRRLSDQQSSQRSEAVPRRSNESELSRKEAQLREQQARLEAAEKSSAEAEQLRKQLAESERLLATQERALDTARRDLDATRRQMTAERHPAVTDDVRMQALAKELSQRESELRTQQAKLADASASLEAERARIARDGGDAASRSAEVEQLRAELRRTQEELASKGRATAAPKSGAALGDAEVRRLETELREKEARLRAQQAKLDATSAAVAKEQKRAARELQAVRAKAPSAGGAKKQAASDSLSQARAELQDLESALADRMAAYQQQSSELTDLLTRPIGADDAQLRSDIETRKQQLANDGKAIAEIRQQSEKQQRKVAELERAGLTVAQAGPEIEIINPVPTLTRGIPSVRIDAGAREILGRVKAPSGLQSLLADGRPIATDVSGTFQIPLPEQRTSEFLTIVATDKQSRRSDLRVNLVSAAAQSTESATGSPPGRATAGHFPGVDFGRFYALIIGNNNYAAYPALRSAVNDAKSIDVILRERYGFKTRLLLNANRHDMLTAINDIKSVLTESDNLLIYYAGHGEIDPKGENGYWLPTDAETGNPANWISSDSVSDLLSVMPARHVLVIADSCYSGALSGSAVAALPNGIDEARKAKWVQAVNARKARTVLTSGGVEPVLDQGGGGHSIFANALLKVLRTNHGVLEDYALFGQIAGPIQSTSFRQGLTQSPQYAALQHAGHEGSPFFFVAEGG